MTDPRNRNRLRPDESAELDRYHQPDHRIQAERATFDVYLSRLALLPQVDAQNLTVVPAHECPACARMVPAGLPSVLRRSQWDLCPACCTARKMDRAISAELGPLLGDDPERDRERFFSAAQRAAGNIIRRRGKR